MFGTPGGSVRRYGANECYAGASVEAAFGITSAQFLAWNPAVSSNCETGFWVGDSYCVGVASGSSAQPTTTTSSLTRTAETTGPDEPTQTGQPSNCDAWYDVVSGDTCIAPLEALLRDTMLTNITQVLRLKQHSASQLPSF
jgi:hypothetical protein